MHFPLLVQTCAHRSAALVPPPPASRSSRPSAITPPSAGSSPAGSTHGAGFDAFAAPRARVGDVIDLAAEGHRETKCCQVPLLSSRPPAAARLCLPQRR